jgi:hypothetical protein
MQIPVTTSGRINPYHPNMRPRLFFAFLAAFGVSAQEPSTLINTGEPMRVAYSCAEEDLQWAGMSCSDAQPCAIYLELNFVVDVGNNGKKIVAAGDLHSSSATIGSVLLQSDDSGATWREPAPRIRGSALDQLQFINPQTGWAAGETLYPLPRDPFFLVTTDGGASWRQRPVGEEDLPGAVQRFWFDSEKHGEAIIDGGKAATDGRYLSYESETGGENWSLHGKSDQLPKLRRAPPPGEDPGWRTHPSTDGKALRIERRNGGEWTPLASFLIEVANCRIHPGELTEPEPAADAPTPAPENPKKRTH